MNNVPVAEMRRFGPNECADDDQRHRLYPSYLKEVDNCEDGRWVVPNVPTAESQYLRYLRYLGTYPVCGYSGLLWFVNGRRCSTPCQGAQARKCG